MNATKNKETRYTMDCNGLGVLRTRLKILFPLCFASCYANIFGTEKHQLLEREKSKQNIDKRVQKHVKLSSYNINMFCRNHFLHHGTSNKLEMLNAISQISISLSYYYYFLLASNVRPVYPFFFTQLFLHLLAHL